MGHRVYFPGLSELEPGLITVAGEEAHHALRVKRLGVGDLVELLDGSGLVAQTRIATTEKTRDGWAIGLEVLSREEVAPVAPFVWVETAVPKGERLEQMIEGLSQVGAGAWRPIQTKRSVVDPREGKLERLERVVVESMKQCGRAWRLQLPAGQPFSQAVHCNGRAVIADASGGEYEACGFDHIKVFIGPEGGWDESELAFARELHHGVRVVRFGPHVMRTEVAAVVAAAQVLEAERRYRARAG